MSYCWYFTQEDIKDKTPSREEGITPAAEARYRRDGARFVINASNTLGLRYDTMATGVVFFHRFFMVQSFKHFDRWVVGAACLLLAGKVEETPKKCKDILKVTRSLLNDQQMAGFGSNPKEELLTHERILLQTVKFDLQLEHPYSYLLKFAKELKGEKSKIEKLVQMAWTFVNDSLCTTLCLQWEPQAIAVAFLYLAGKLTKFDLQGLSQSKSRSWWRQFVDTLDFHDLESICHQVLDIYGERESEQKKAESVADEVDPTRRKTPPTNVVTPPTGSATPGTPTQGQLLSVHHQQQRYHSNHHSPSPVPPPPPPPHGAAPMVVAPPTCMSGIVVPQAVIQQGSSLQQSQMTYIGHQAYNLGDPLQALQAIRPVTNTATATLPYSTLNVSVGNTTALPRGAPMIQQTFSQLPGQQQQIVGGYQQQVATPLGGQVIQKNLSATVNASSLQGSALRAGTGTTNYQQQMGVLAGVGSTGIQLGRIGTGTGIGSGTQIIGNMRTGQPQQQPGLVQTQQTLGGQSYLTPPPAKRTAYDLSSYRHTSSGVLPQASLLSAQNLTTLNQTMHQQQQQLTKPPSLLPPTTNSLTMNRLPSLLGQQQQTNTLYRTNSQTQHGTPLVVGVASQLPGGAVAGQQLSSLSLMTQVGGRAGHGGVGTGGGGLPGQGGHMGAAGGTPTIRPVSGLPQAQPSPTARPQSGYSGLQQNYGASSGSGRGAAGWGTR